jgi:hypothetical protein
VFPYVQKNRLIQVSVDEVWNCAIPLFILIIAIGLLLAADQAAFGGMQSGSYAITTDVVAGGGGVMSSGNYHLQSTIGQPSSLMDQAEPPYSTAYDLYPGFWYTLEAGPGPVCVNLAAFAASFGSLAGDGNYSLSCDFELDGDVDGSDLQAFINGL